MPSNFLLPLRGQMSPVSVLTIGVTYRRFVVIVRVLGLIFQGSILFVFGAVRRAADGSPRVLGMAADLTRSREGRCSATDVFSSGMNTDFHG